MARETVVSAAEWPVFESYEVLDGPRLTKGAGKRERYICPADGAAIDRRLDFTQPRLRREALRQAMALTRATGDRSEAMIAYADRFGLFGAGVARILWAVQPHVPGARLPALVYRLGGSLRVRGLIRDVDKAVENSFALELEKLWLSEESWVYCRPGVSLQEAFSHQIGSEEWWRLYAEPLDSISETLSCIASCQRLPGDPLRDSESLLEAALSDTYIRLPKLCERFNGHDTVSLSDIQVRSVSALGALAIAVTEGALEGWRVCIFDRCGRVYEGGRSDQVYCSDSCRDKAAKQRKRQLLKAEGDGTDGR